MNIKDITNMAIMFGILLVPIGFASNSTGMIVFGFVLLIGAFLVIKMNDRWVRDGYSQIVNEKFENFKDDVYIDELYRASGLVNSDFEFRNVFYAFKGEMFENYPLIMTTLDITLERMVVNKTLDMIAFAHLNIPKNIQGTIRICGGKRDVVLTGDMAEIKSTNLAFNERYRVYLNDLKLEKEILNDTFTNEFMKLHNKYRVYSEGLDIIINNNDVYIQLDCAAMADYLYINSDLYKLAMKRFKLKIMFILDFVKIIKENIERNL